MAPDQSNPQCGTAESPNEFGFDFEFEFVEIFSFGLR